MDLSPDQERALDLLLEALKAGKKVLVLGGPAGSGKTTLMRAFKERIVPLGYKTRFLAPTGKAAERLSRVTGDEASTIHQALFSSVKETRDGIPVFLNPKAPCDPNTVLVIDESSMVPDTIGEEICRQIPASSAILYVGDPNQIPPVAGKRAPDFENPTAMLEFVHRTALENPIFFVSSKILAGEKLPVGKVGDSYERRNASLEEVSRRYVEAVQAGEDAVLLCWTNDCRQRLNRLVRRSLGFLTEAPEPGDRLVVLANNKRLNRMNGEILKVTEVKKLCDIDLMKQKIDDGVSAGPVEWRGLKISVDDDRHVLISRDLFGAEIKAWKEFQKTLKLTENWHWVACDWGHAITFHKSQGSEWKKVFIVIDEKTKAMARRDPLFSRQILYTAFTRAKEAVYVFDC